MVNKFTLSELNEHIKDTLLDAFPAAVWVVAEISELKVNRSGHCYLELIEKQENTILARSRATIWSYTYRMLKPYFESSTGQRLNHGIKVLVSATVEYHPAYGLSLNIKDIDPTYTVGDMAMQRKEIIQRLQKEGVFEMNKELELPLVPQRIAVISSATAAGYQDFMNQLHDNDYGIVFQTQLFEAYMQGEETVPSIIRALEQIFQYEELFDAVAIIRGGGATADLSSFDNYDLAINVTQFPLPVITGIGHEKDDTVIDLVAHTRMKTPTAVAEFFINGAGRFFEQLLEMEERIVQLTRESLDFQQEKLERIAEGLKYSVSDFITERQFQLNKKGSELQQNVAAFSFNKKKEITEKRHDLESILSLRLMEEKNNINDRKRVLRRTIRETVLKSEASLMQMQTSIGNSAKQMLLKENERIRLNENTMRLLNPENILKRGFTLTLSNGKIIKSAGQLNEGEVIETRFADGDVASKIIKKHKNGN